MKLEALASKPTLKKITLDSKEIVEKYGDSVEFWMYDRFDMDMYLRMSQVNGQDVTEISKLVRDVVLNEAGDPVLKSDEVLPPDMMLKVIESAVRQMGNLESQTSAA